MAPAPVSVPGRELFCKRITLIRLQTAQGRAAAGLS